MREQGIHPLMALTVEVAEPHSIVVGASFALYLNNFSPTPMPCPCFSRIKRQLRGSVALKMGLEYPSQAEK